MGIKNLLRRCLQKNPHNRLHDIADARIEIQEALAGPPAEVKVAAQSSPKWSIWFWIMAGLFFIVSCFFILKIFTPSRTEPDQVQHLMVALPEAAPLAHAGVSPLGSGRPCLALSPNGSKVVYSGLVGDNSQLFIHWLNQNDVEPIHGTTGSHSPFFSPNGKWVGFFADEMLKKVSLSGGEPEVICAAPLGYGGTWGLDENIYFIPKLFEEIWKVTSSGGSPQPIMTEEIRKQRPEYLLPENLPGEDAILFSTRDSGFSIYSFQSGRIKAQLDRGFYARYSPTGHIVFGQGAKLSAIPFNLDKLELSGIPVTILEGIKTERLGVSQYTFSKQGLMIYAPGADAALGNLIWVSREGKTEPLALPKADYGTFKLSPNGEHVAVVINETEGSNIMDI